ncbi:hypothetical protein GGH95_001897 [Coemansia sp. RSA 1836]|nr:hypothetical protein GGH95_001897 [Coemansia sp. RSA 1836]
MNRNRMSEFAARRKEGSGDDSRPPSSPDSLDDAGANQDMEKYLTALGGIERDIAATSNGVDELGVLHGRLLSTADGTKAEGKASWAQLTSSYLSICTEMLTNAINFYT